MKKVEKTRKIAKSLPDLYRVLFSIPGIFWLKYFKILFSGKTREIATFWFFFTFNFRSAFFHYASDERPKVRAANPNFAVGDIAKELGRRWADADPSHKSKYEARAEKDRERYIKQKAEFQQVLEDEKNGIVHKESKDIRKKFIDSDAEEEVEEAEPVEEDEAESEWESN